MGKVEKVQDWIDDPERSHWDDHPDYPVEDWQSEVANGDTRQSYRDWLLCRAAMEDDEYPEPL